MPNKKEAPQFAYANEEATYLHSTIKKRIERDECKAHKKTTSEFTKRK